MQCRLQGSLNKVREGSSECVKAVVSDSCKPASSSGRSFERIAFVRTSRSKGGKPFYVHFSSSTNGKVEVFDICAFMAFSQPMWRLVALVVLCTPTAAAASECGGSLNSRVPRMSLHLRRRGAGVLQALGAVRRTLASRGRPSEGRSDQSFDVLFVGSGVSTGVPRIGCIVRPDESQPVCTVCTDALKENSRYALGSVA
jgi:hypothetical protein